MANSFSPQAPGGRATDAPSAASGDGIVVLAVDDPGPLPIAAQPIASPPPVRLVAAVPVTREIPVDAQLVAEPFSSATPRSWPIRAWQLGRLVCEWLFGLFSLLACLAVLAAIPLVQFVSLGYLLEASARVARSGRLRDGFIDFPKFARIGSLVAGTWLMLLPLRLLADLARSAYLIDPGSDTARAWRLGLIVATTLMVGHILLAWYSGGRLRHFFWPLLAPFQLAAHLVLGRLLRPLLERAVRAVWPALADDLFALRPMSDWFPPAIVWAGMRRGRMYAEARDAVWDFVVGLRLPFYFWLGVRGFAGALAWLFVPVLLLMCGTTIQSEGAPLVGWLGALLLAFVLLYLPFLQTHFAAENRFTAMFQWGEIRRMFRRAPLAFWLGLTVTCLFALPLYLLKIEATPREVTWLPSMFFVVFIYPARLLTGWAMGRARKREQPRFFLLRWMARFAAVPVVLYYVLVVFFTQYTSWSGPVSLFEQHAFLLPAPFFGL